MLISLQLLQVVLYHRHACEALSDDALLELADWAVRKLSYLNSGAAAKHANMPGEKLVLVGAYVLY